MKLFAFISIMLILPILYSYAAPIYPSDGTGNTVCLFESGTGEIRNAITVHDTLIVYRQKGDKQDCVGKIEVIGFNGNYHINGIIIDGELSEGDIAKKGKIACFIISIGTLCKK